MILPPVRLFAHLERVAYCPARTKSHFWYDQDQGEFVILLQDVARLRFEGDNPFEMKPGEFINIPAHRRHRVEWTMPDEPCVWLAVHYAD